MFRIVILDSGIDQALMKNQPNILLKNFTEEDDYDLNGHGTKTYSLIRQLSKKKNFQIKVIKVLNRDLECNYLNLKNALEFLERVDFDILNISLATECNKYFDDINNICHNLNSQGKTIVASHSNTNKLSYPASSKYVIGVLGEKMNNWFDYNILHQDNKDVIADNTPVVCSTINGGYDLYSGNSKATACITSLLTYFKKDVKLFETLSFNNYDLRQIIRRINNIELLRNTDESINLIERVGRNKFEEFLHEISLEFDINYEENLFNINDFSSSISLSNKIYETKQRELYDII